MIGKQGPYIWDLIRLILNKLRMAHFPNKRRRLDMDVDTMMSTTGSASTADTSSGGFGSGRVIHLDRPFRPANKLFAKPRWHVPKWQYNKLKKHIMTKNKKKGYYNRGQYGGRGGSGRYDGHLGPIVITGRGGYYTDKLRSAASAGYRALQRGVPTGTFSRLGTAMGGAAFGAPGALLGGLAGSGIAKLAGFGDYTVNANSLLTLDEGMQVPSFGDLNHAIVISHREYIGDISIPATPANFTLSSYPINPGLSQTFPWLSTIAPSFDQYEILGMIFEFKSTSSDFGTTTSLAMGTVILATDYDSSDSNYGSKIEMENAQYSTSCKPSISCIHAIECDPNLNFSPVKYVRTGGVPSSKDIRLYDQGNFQLATVGLPTGSSGVIGELWVSYQIKFMKPQLTLSTDVLGAYYSASSYDGTHYFGINGSADPNNSIQISVSGNVMTFSNLVPNSFLQFTWLAKFSSQAIAAGLVTAFSGFTVVDSAASNTGTFDNYVYTGVLKVTASSATITLSNLTVASGQTVVRTLVTAMDTDVIRSAYNQ